VAVVLCISPGGQTPLSALEALGHQLIQVTFDPQQLADAPRHDVVLLDCRHNLSAEWGLQDFVLEGASLAEVDARVRILLDAKPTQQSEVKNSTGLTIDLASYTAKIAGKALDLTFKEFELLRHLNENPGRVFSREQLLSEVWGYDYFGGTRTVDVHIRRLRAKLGEHESLIGTVRNVGYRLNPDGQPEENS